MEADKFKAGDRVKRKPNATGAPLRGTVKVIIDYEYTSCYLVRIEADDSGAEINEWNYNLERDENMLEKALRTRDVWNTPFRG